MMWKGLCFFTNPSTGKNPALCGFAGLFHKFCLYYNCY